MDADVLVVGSGPSGATTALLLALHGLDVTLVTRETWVADSPRAHITNQRTMEVLLAIGLEEQCRAQATPAELMANHVLCTSLSGEEFGRVAGPGKLGPEPLRNIFLQVAWQTGTEDTPGAFRCGLRAVSVDGSVPDVPDSKANDEHFGRPASQSRDGAFAQVRWVVAAESWTGSLLGAALGRYRTSEQELAADLLEQECFGPGMIVLADRKFCPGDRPTTAPGSSSRPAGWPPSRPPTALTPSGSAGRPGHARCPPAHGPTNRPIHHRARKQPDVSLDLTATGMTVS